MNLLIILSIVVFIFCLYEDFIYNKKENIVSKSNSKEIQFSFKKYAWNQFKKNKLAKYCLYLLGILVVIALFAPYLANERPLYAVYKGETIYPAFASEKQKDSIFNSDGEFERVLQYDITDWRTLEYEKVIWAPIKYDQKFVDKYNRNYRSPWDKQRYKNSEGKITEIPTKFRHVLGTDNIGRDLAAGLIHGTRISLLVGLISMGIASIIGIILGALAGYFGDTKLKMSRSKYIFTLIGIFMGIFYGFGERKYAIADGFGKDITSGLIELLISIIVIIGTVYIFRIVSRFFNFGYFKNEVKVPIDSFVSRGIELLNSIPRLLLIITLTSVVAQSIWIVMVIIGLTSWTGIARFTRAEFLRIRSLEYVQAAQSLGFSSIRTIFKHALPNALAPVLVSIAFGIASAILIESGLSFLGIGVDPETVTWGSLLNGGRSNIDAWWLIIFPGIAIFMTITIYNTIAEAMRDALDPKLKS